LSIAKVPEVESFGGDFHPFAPLGTAVSLWPLGADRRKPPWPLAVEHQQVEISFAALRVEMRRATLTSKQIREKITVIIAHDNNESVYDVIDQRYGLHLIEARSRSRGTRDQTVWFKRRIVTMVPEVGDRSQVMIRFPHE
jgi:hypothetical protein